MKKIIAYNNKCNNNKNILIIFILNKLIIKLTCQCRIILHTNPSVSLGFPSTISLLLIFTSFT